jgi:RHS repeat-associated protein
LPASLPRTRTLLTTRPRWRNRVSVRRRASGRAHYNYFRDYDPAIGGYVESDPIGLKGGVNTYGYVGANPLTYSDSLGLVPGTGTRPRPIPPKASAPADSGPGKCGSGLNEPFVPDNPFNFRFSGCCKDHDGCYDTCGKSRAECDDAFCGCLSSQCSPNYGAAVFFTCLKVARTYCDTVAEKGQPYYDAAQKKCKAGNCSRPK